LATRDVLNHLTKEETDELNVARTNYYYVEGDLKKSTFHFEAAAMAGNEVARFNLGAIESESGNMERAFKHWIISASSGYCYAMQNLRTAFEDGLVSIDTIESTLTAYNTSCVEMRSISRDAVIRLEFERIRG
jgi:TPR repeat protein